MSLISWNLEGIWKDRQYVIVFIMPLVNVFVPGVRIQKLEQFDPKAKSIWTLGKTFESQHVLKQSSGYVSQSTSVPTILRGWATLSTLASVLCLKLVYGWSQLVDITAFFPAIFMSYGLLALWNCWLLAVLFMLGTNRMYCLPLQIRIWSKLDFFDFIVQF